jgi:hypothetical protein
MRESRFAVNNFNNGMRRTDHLLTPAQGPKDAPPKEINAEME